MLKFAHDIIIEHKNDHDTGSTDFMDSRQKAHRRLFRMEASEISSHVMGSELP